MDVSFSGLDRFAAARLRRILVHGDGMAADLLLLRGSYVYAAACCVFDSRSWQAPIPLEGSMARSVGFPGLLHFWEEEESIRFTSPSVFFEVPLHPAPGRYVGMVEQSRNSCSLDIMTSEPVRMQVPGDITVMSSARGELFHGTDRYMPGDGGRLVDSEISWYGHAFQWYFLPFDGSEPTVIVGTSHDGKTYDVEGSPYLPSRVERRGRKIWKGDGWHFVPGVSRHTSFRLGFFTMKVLSELGTMNRDGLSIRGLLSYGEFSV